MFGFSRRRMKIGRLKVQLADSTQGTKSPIRHPKRLSQSTGENVVSANSPLDDANFQCLSSELDPSNCTSGNSENWMVLSTLGEKPSPRFNHAAAVVGSKMVVVGGESAHGLLEDVQVLNFDKLTWTAASPKFYLSPSSLPLKIPGCKGHCLVSWGKKVLMIGGKTDPSSEKITVWAFDTENECWSHVEAKGDIPIARSCHTVVRAGSMLILFGGEGLKGRKLNDLHMFDLKSLMWLPLHSTGNGPSPRSNHVAALYEDRVLLIFGGASKSRINNDLYSLDFETMMWSRIKTKGFHPTPRAGCRGVLFGSKWYIAGGGSRKKRHPETLVFDVLKVEWSMAATSSTSSITTNKGFSLVLIQHKDRAFLVAFGGNKKEMSNQVEVLAMLKNEQSVGLQSIRDKDPLFFKKCSMASRDFASHLGDGVSGCPINSAARNNLTAGVEHHGSGRRSLSEFSANPNSKVSLHKQLQHEEEYNPTLKMQKILEDDKYMEVDDVPVPNISSSQVLESRGKPQDARAQTDNIGVLAEQVAFALEPENSRTYTKKVNETLASDDDMIPVDTDGNKASRLVVSANIYRLYETKMAALLRRNNLLEGQVNAALANREISEKNLSSAIKSRLDTERRLGDALKEMELLKEKLAAVEVAQEEANSLSNIVHSDNVRLEHDVAFLKAVLDDTQKELHSTRGVLAGERSRAFQLQVEVFHLKQRLQSLENRAPTPRKPFHV
ncbi:acyl-CoA-binding domain-containing protein 4-like [Aristolochia californica]|uniref:acyl-CoA-binding domain-containing protein 4-like n=1 Tax=Aristolochia californica TaxID=171875 RepID=UPI0035D5BC40